MPDKVLGAKKTYQIKQKRSNGSTYVYDRTVVYNPESKQNEVLESRIVGKIVPGSDEIVPTRPKKNGKQDKRDDALDVAASRKHVGMMNILEHAGKASGIDDLLYRITDTGSAEKIISLARYLVAENGQTLPGIVSFQFRHPLPYQDGLSEDIYHTLFDEIGSNESMIQRFFLGRALSLGDEPILAYDSTNIATYSDNQVEAVHLAHSKSNHKGLPELKLLVLYTLDDRQPIAYTKRAGNVPDVVTIQAALNELEILGCSKARIVSDNGYYSQENIADMYVAGFKFLTRVKDSLGWVRKLIDENRSALETMSSICPDDPRVHGVTVVSTQSFQRRRRYASSKKALAKGDLEPVRRRIYTHILFDETKKVEEDVILDKQLAEIRQCLENGTVLSGNAQRMASKFFSVSETASGREISFNEKAYQTERAYHGFLILISNDKMEASQALSIYRQRNTIELFFEILKQRIDGDRPRVWDSDRLRGRLFVQFVALCYYEYLAMQLRVIKADLGQPNGEPAHDTKENLNNERKLLHWLERQSLHDVLKWFDTVESVEISTSLRRKRWTSEILSRDKLLLNKLGVI